MKPFPILTTKRLTLSKILATDIPTIVKYAGSEQIAATTLNIPHPYEEKDAISWIHMANQGFQNKTQYTFSVRLNTTNEFIGGIGLRTNFKMNRAELGYWIAEPFWNLGMTTEAASTILKFGFETLSLNKIYATHVPENPASGKVMIKNGMIKEGELKEHVKKGAEYKTIIQYRLTRKEYDDLKRTI